MADRRRTVAARRPTFLLRLRAEPGVSDPVRILRAALKMLGRRFKLKALSVVEERHDERDGA